MLELIQDESELPWATASERQGGLSIPFPATCIRTSKTAVPACSLCVNGHGDLSKVCEGIRFYKKLPLGVLSLLYLISCCCLSAELVRHTVDCFPHLYVEFRGV